MFLHVLFKRFQLPAPAVRTSFATRAKRARHAVLVTALEEGDHVEAPPLHLLPGAPEEAAELVLPGK